MERPSPTSDRRRFLRHAAVGATAYSLGRATRPAAAAQRDESVDLNAAAQGAGLEIAAVALHSLSLDRGLLDPTAGAVILQFVAHHQEHAATFNRVLETSSRSVIGEADTALVESLAPFVLNALDAPTLLAAAYRVEQTLAATYTDALGELTVPSTALAFARILPVESQHALVLAFVLGLPLEEQLPAFEPTDASVLER